MQNYKALAVVLTLFAALTSQARSNYGINPEQIETARWAFDMAQQFSGIHSLEREYNPQKLPIIVLSESEMGQEVCPEDPGNCHGLAGLFETKKKVIFIRSDLRPESDLVSLSFLVHEMVHSLQAEFKTEDELFGTCEKLFATEKQAYDAQDAFLKSEGQFFRAGNALRFFNCDNK